MTDRDVNEILEELNKLQIREASLKNELRKKLECQKENKKDTGIVGEQKRRIRHSWQSWNSLPSEITTDSVEDRVGPKDSNGAFINVGDKIEAVTRGKSRAITGKVINISEKTVTFADSEGRKHWRKHHNVTVTKLHHYSK